MKIGDSLTVALADGTEVRGQVWSLAPLPDYVWVALDNGTYVKVFTPRGTVYDEHHERVGEVRVA